MSSSSAAFARALSPSMEGLTTAILQSNISSNHTDDELAAHSEERILILHAKITDSRSVDQVIDCIPNDYRAALREPFLLYASWCEKMESVNSSKDRLTAALSAQTVPPRLRVKAPEFQFTKEFGEANTDAASAARNAFTAATATFQAAINAASL